MVWICIFLRLSTLGCCVVFLKVSRVQVTYSLWKNIYTCVFFPFGEWVGYFVELFVGILYILWILILHETSDLHIVSSVPG